MCVKPSTTLCNDNEAVIMEKEVLKCREQMLALRERLLISERERLSGKMISLDEAGQRLQRKFKGID